MSDEMKTVMAAGLTLGEGRPKICVPIIGRTQKEILAEGQKIAALRGRGADLCEWRIDWFDEVWNTGRLIETGRALKAALGGMPLLTTFRTKGEGGERACDASRYTALCCQIAAAGFTDLLDIELFTGDCLILEIVGTARSHDVRTIFSSHDFHHTPAKEEMVRRLTRMEELGADICKLAVSPERAEDVLALLDATLTRFRTGNTPLITMSMGALGTLSRLCGELTGSCLTFGSLSAASAPGQLPAEKLYEMLELLRLERER